MKKLFLLIGILYMVLIFIAGCGPSSVVVRTRPEPPYYARPIAPGPNYIWVDGDWIRHNHGYVYRQGYWATPRPRYHHYVNGKWQNRRNGWYWVPGHWN